MRVLLAVIVGFVLAASASGPAMARDLRLPAPNSKGGTPPHVADDEYAIDDGTFDLEVFAGGGGDTWIWLTQFNVVAGLETITAVRIAWTGPGGHPGEAMIFNDPNNDGSPTDITPADLLASVPLVTGAGPTNAFSTYPVPNVAVGNPGDSFFVGVCVSFESGDAAALLLDTSDPDHGRGWFQSGVDCSNPNGINPLVPHHAVFPPGDLMFRANATSSVAVEGPPATSFLRVGSPRVTSGSTLVTFGLEQAGVVDVTVYDVAGRTVYTLVHENLAVGVHMRDWQGRDLQGRSVAAGIYLIHLKSAGKALTQKLVLTK